MQAEQLHQARGERGRDPTEHTDEAPVRDRRNGSRCFVSIGRNDGATKDGRQSRLCYRVT